MEAYKCPSHTGRHFTILWTSREPKAPGETNPHLISQYEGTKMITMDDPYRNAEPRDLGKPPPTLLTQTEEVASKRPQGKKSPRQEVQKSPTYRRGKHATSSERDPLGKGTSSSQYLQEKGSEKQGQPRTRASTSRDPQEHPTAGQTWKKQTP